MTTAPATKHTPGPWIWHQGHDSIWTPKNAVGPSSGGLYGPNYEAVAIGIWRNDGDADCEATTPENARLIAAAPQLLAAVVAASHALKSYAYGNSATDLAEGIAKSCDEAIALATRETA
jgi:hypothetical protein